MQPTLHWILFTRAYRWLWSRWISSTRRLCIDLDSNRLPPARNTDLRLTSDFADDCSRAWTASTGLVRRRFCSGALREAKPLPEMNFRQGRAVAGEVKAQMSEYSNISANILELVDRRLYQQEGHPLCTLAQL
jgi:hypothetical protein